MFEQQRLVDLQETESFGDLKSWLSKEHQSSPPRQPFSSLSSGNGSDFDRVLFKNLVEMVPLVESLMDRRANTSFTRRASMIYTKTPSRESYLKKVSEPKGSKVSQSIPIKKRRDLRENDPSKNASADEFSIFSSRAPAVEKDSEELIMLQEKVENLQNKLLEKDELLKSAESSMNQLASVHAKLDELRRQTAEKDSLIKSAHLQISDAKIKLADKQAALEKIQWEATTSNRKVEELQEDLESSQGEISAFMLLFEGLTTNESAAYTENHDTALYHSGQLPYIDDMDEMEVEDAREAYISAVTAAKENQDEESLAIAAKARLRLQSFVLRPKNVNSNDGNHTHLVF